MTIRRTSERLVALAIAATALAGGIGLTTATSASADAVDQEWKCTRNPRGWDHMDWRTCLLPGDSLVSGNGDQRLVYQNDGNLVQYDEGGHAVWTTGTANTTPGRVIMQSDGNLVVYDRSMRALWASGTALGCNPPVNWLRLQNDGNLVIYRPHDDGPWTAVWSRLNGRVGTC
ncbi:hypothetical protein ACIF6L_14415 [Kitasatospora sp. NPDC086009]|uniref:hypothetical protein n=1 Tax=unclassified Kitasatospora TaxID=2633591 RepID=UPI0037CC7D5D